MNNTKSQNGNLYSLTLLVKKNKKNFGKERTNLPDWPGGGGVALVDESTKREEGGGGLYGSRAPKLPNLRAKHTFPRKYGTKKAENRSQKAENRPPSLNPDETG